MTDAAPRRGRRFRSTRGTAVRRVLVAAGTPGRRPTDQPLYADETTDICIVTAVREGRVYYRWWFPGDSIDKPGEGAWYVDIEPSATWQRLRPGFAALVAEWLP